MRIEKPNAVLSIATAELLGLAVHELAADALEYGTLEVPEATVNIG